MSTIEEYEKKKKELNKKYIEPLEKNLNEYRKLLDVFKEEGDERILKQLKELEKEINSLEDGLMKESFVEYDGRLYKGNLFLRDAEFLSKWKSGINKIKVEDNFIKSVDFINKDVKEEVYESGDLALLEECDIIDLAETGIKNLEGSKLPKKVKKIEAWSCKNLIDYDLSNIEECEVINLHETGIKKLEESKLPKKVKIISATLCENLTDYNLSNIECEKIYLAMTGIKKLEGSKLPKKVKKIDATWCTKLTDYDLKDIECDEIYLRETGIKKLEGSKLPKNLKGLRVSKSCDVSDIENNNKFKNLKIMKI